MDVNRFFDFSAVRPIKWYQVEFCNILFLLITICRPVATPRRGPTAAGEPVVLLVVASQTADEVVVLDGGVGLLDAGVAGTEGITYS